jgi:mannosyl-oligosaccharide alpha-1,2-mannosidase
VLIACLHLTLANTRAARYRAFLLVAGLITILVIRLANQSEEWEAPDEQLTDSLPIVEKIVDSETFAITRPPLADMELTHSDETVFKSLVIPKPPDTKSTAVEAPKTAPPAPPATKLDVPIVPTTPPAALPDTEVLPPTGTVADETVEIIHPVAPPGRQEALFSPPLPTPIHWERQQENFPVPTESIIQLPTGPPVSIPRIQHKFNDETPDSKINREKRQSKVKDEFKRAWAGYRKHAWLHDELSPVKGKFRDPFCGWAATLVDSLDTLWIMGLEEEFEDAVRGVETIDFTTSPRGDIPVFETTIRYLGGLLAAYDVSGGKYKSLLDKAVQLGDILLGAFDTPNRMPVLFYQWRPAFASQPHRASQRANLAELGSLSMEFTRLAQLTKNPRYYDAVARVTNELSEWQDRNTSKLEGVFPENVDASGCNRTVPNLVVQPIGGKHATDFTDSQPAEGYKPEISSTVAVPQPGKTPNLNTPALKSGDDEEGGPRRRIAGWDENRAKDQSAPKNQKREEQVPIPAPTTAITPKHPISGVPLNPQAQRVIVDPLSNWDCEPQGIDSTSPFSADKFSMGGGQDSTYEYFPKQYLLLSGRDETYKKMYLKTVAAIRRWMLYRPMVPDNRDILFSGSLMTAGHPEKDRSFVAEVEHLTCFIGGMIGMGAKIFDIEGDLEIAKKLADGCVWAYESTPSGIMPEGSTVIACENMDECAWNQTLYEYHLDPNAKLRDDGLQAYLDRKKKQEKEEAEKKTKEIATAAAAEAILQTVGIPAEDGSQMAGIPAEELSQMVTIPADGSLKKRQIITEEDLLPAVEPNYQAKLAPTDVQLTDIPGGHGGVTNLPKLLPSTTEEEATKETVDPLRPQSHKEYVAERIKTGRLPPGFVSLRGKKYILR